MSEDFPGYDDGLIDGGGHDNGDLGAGDHLTDHDPGDHDVPGPDPGDDDVPGPDPGLGGHGGDELDAAHSGAVEATPHGAALDLPEHAGDTVDTTYDDQHHYPVSADEFPEPLHTEVTPSDGLSWIEPDLLGVGESRATESVAGHEVEWAPREELLDGLSDDDPAERALMSFWSGQL